MSFLELVPLFYFHPFQGNKKGTLCKDKGQFVVRYV